MLSRQDIHLCSCLVFPLPSFCHLLAPSLQTRVTLLQLMAFCLAELHLWSTKSSLQVKGTTYHHVRSPSLSQIVSSRSIFLSPLTLFSHLLQESDSLSHQQFPPRLFSLSRVCLFALYPTLFSLFLSLLIVFVFYII